MDIYTGINFQNQYSIGLGNDEDSFESATGSKIELRKKYNPIFVPMLPG